MRSTDSLVPEGFDLEEAKRAESTTPRSERNQCPECRSVELAIRTERNGRDRMYDGKYACRNCGTHFDDPIRGDHDA